MLEVPKAMDSVVMQTPRKRVLIILVGAVTQDFLYGCVLVNRVRFQSKAAGTEDLMDTDSTEDYLFGQAR